MKKRSTIEIDTLGESKAPGEVFRINHEYRGMGWAGVNQNGLTNMYFDEDGQAKARAEKYAQTTYKSNYRSRMSSGLRGTTGMMIQ